MDKLEQMPSPTSSSTAPANGRKSSLRRNTLSSDDVNDTQNDRPKRKTAHFDEENIKKTYHPTDKTYGFDQIEEPKTPFERSAEPVDSNLLTERLEEIVKREQDDAAEPVDSNLLTERLEEIVKREQDDAAEVSPQTSSSSGLRPTSNVPIDSASVSFAEASFEERRRKHIQSEFIVAKQAPTEEEGVNSS